MQKIYLGLIGIAFTGMTFASEIPLCSLPQAGSNTAVDNAGIEGDPDPGCAAILKAAQVLAQKSPIQLNFTNTSTLPPQLSVGAVYLQAITMAPAGMMKARSESDIHLEIDIHAKQNLKARGFAPGDWLPNVAVTYTIQKIGAATPLICGTNPQTKAASSTCPLMAMAASDGAHYGDNVKLAGPGFYIVTFSAKTDPSQFGWHTDTDSKLLGTEYVDFHFTQSYLMKWTGIGKKGGY